MRIKCRIFVLTLLLCLLISCLLPVGFTLPVGSKNRADENPVKKRALLVGIGKYVSEGDTKCTSTEKDIVIARRSIPEEEN